MVGGYVWGWGYVGGGGYVVGWGVRWGGGGYVGGMEVLDGGTSWVRGYVGGGGTLGRGVDVRSWSKMLFLGTFWKI